MSTRPSPVPALRALAERTVRVSDVVIAPIWQVAPSTVAAEVAAEMAARDFDVAAIEDRPIRQFVRQADVLAEPEATVGELAVAIDAGDIVSRALPVADLIARLGTSDCVFVMDNEQIRWLATRADLQAPAIGMVVLAYLIAFEAALSDLVPGALGDQYTERLPCERLQKVTSLFLQKQRDNAETGLGDCLYFEDWLTLAEKSPRLRATFGARSRREFQQLIGGFKQARNALAHGGTLLDDRSALEAISLFTRVRTVTEAAWTSVSTMDGRWDLYVATDIKAADGSTWAGAGAVALDQTWHVITAANPDSRALPPEINARSNGRLRNLLTGRGLRPMGVIASAPDGSWSEESFAVAGCTSEALCALGHDFGQAAVFEVTPTELRVLRCPDAKVMRTRVRAVTADGWPGGSS